MILYGNSIHIDWKVQETQKETLCTSTKELSEQLFLFYKWILLDLCVHRNIQIGHLLYFGLANIVLMHFMKDIQDSDEYLYKIFVPPAQLKEFLEEGVNVHGVDLDILLQSTDTKIQNQKSSIFHFPGLYKENKKYILWLNNDLEIVQNNKINKAKDLLIKNTEQFIIDRVVNGKYFLLIEGSPANYKDILEVFKKCTMESIVFYDISTEYYNKFSHIFSEECSQIISKHLYQYIKKNMNFSPLMSGLIYILNLYSQNIEKSKDNIYKVYENNVCIGTFKCNEIFDPYISQYFKNYVYSSSEEIDTQYQPIYKFLFELVKNENNKDFFVEYMKFISCLHFILEKAQSKK